MTSSSSSRSNRLRVRPSNGLPQLIVGLGNLDDKYRQTKHNVGFIVVDSYVSGLKLRWELKKKLAAYIAMGDTVVFAKPTTQMNLSGSAVSKLLNFYDITLRDLLIIHDDADLAQGQVKLQENRGTAGHHGIEDIVKKVGSKEFWRLRIGIGRPKSDKFNIQNWVFSKFSDEELPKLVEVAHPEIDKFLSKH